MNKHTNWNTLSIIERCTVILLATHWHINVTWRRVVKYIHKILCRFGYHHWKMYGGGYQDVRCTRCKIWWDE